MEGEILLYRARSTEQSESMDKREEISKSLPNIPFILDPLGWSGHLEQDSMPSKISTCSLGLIWKKEVPTITSNFGQETLQKLQSKTRTFGLDTPRTSAQKQKHPSLSNIFIMKPLYKNTKIYIITMRLLCKTCKIYRKGNYWVNSKRFLGSHELDHALDDDRCSLARSKPFAQMVIVIWWWWESEGATWSDDGEPSNKLRAWMPIA